MEGVRIQETEDGTEGVLVYEKKLAGQMKDRETVEEYSIARGLV